MKELSIEEKAKAYDFSLNRAKRLYEQGTITESLSYVFPQLKKLGDEEVRKEIMQLFRGMYEADPRKERWLAWLEKQGKEANFLSKIQVGDIFTRNEGGELVKISQLNMVAKKRKKQGDENLIMAKSPQLGFGEQTPAWSKEDALRLEEVICMIEANGRWVRSDDAVKLVLDWLKSLKYRVGCEAHCTTTKEWSEEDEKIFNGIILRCKKYGNQEQIDWLKSLRPQKQWKPSEEQMEALDFAANCIVPAEFCVKRKVLKELLEQLKKLREE